MQIGGMHITYKHEKVITPKILQNFFTLIETQTSDFKSQLNNLWMIIGASNYYQSDLGRFAEEYDISITDDRKRDTDNIDKNIEKLTKIFTKGKYNVQHITSGNYPNNPSKQGHIIKKIYLITRN